MTCLSAISHGRPAAVAIVLWWAVVAVAVWPPLPARAITTAPALPVYNSLAQADDDSGETEVPPGEIEKYVAVYKAMQRDRTLTVDQAATQQGLTVQAFRDLESRVQRDDAALQRARDELQAAAMQATASGRPTSATPEK